jgi:mutator protein MutT
VNHSCESGQDAGRAEIAVVVPVREGRFWVRIRHESGSLNNCWEFPGGKLHPDETPRSGARREMAEETGVQVPESCLEPVVTVDHDYVDRKVRIHFFKMELEIELKPGQGEWLSLGELKLRPIPAANWAAIERILESH